MPRVKDNPALGRFEMTSGGSTASVEYRRAGERIALLHTEVPEALSGKGVGSALVRGTLDAVRAEGLKVDALRLRPGEGGVRRSRLGGEDRRSRAAGRIVGRGER